MKNPIFKKVVGRQTKLTNFNFHNHHNSVQTILDELKVTKSIINSGSLEDEQNEYHFFITPLVEGIDSDDKYSVFLIILNKETNTAWVQNHKTAQTNKDNKIALREFKQLDVTIALLEKDLKKFIAAKAKETPDMIATLDEEGDGTLFIDLTKEEIKKIA